MKDLTNFNDILYIPLQNDPHGNGMKGTIETKEKCPVCQKKFTHIKKFGYICQSCKTTPRRFYIYFSYQGNRYRIYSTPQGTPLDSYHVAQSVLIRINEELKNHNFDPTKYVKSELKKFFILNLIDEYHQKKSLILHRNTRLHLRNI